MLDASRVTELLVRAREFASDHNLGDNLEGKLSYLANYAGGERTRCRLFPDGAPLSFAFTMERLNAEGGWEYWFNGGLLFHGAHDRHGSGGAPTYAVTLSPTTGWSIHT